MKQRRRMRRGAGAVMLAALLVAGCSKSAPEREPEAFDNGSEATTAPVAPPVIEAPSRPPEPAVNTAEALPPEEDPSREAQMLEDADATGLTARTTPADGASDPGADPIGDLVENGGVVSR